MKAERVVEVYLYYIFDLSFKWSGWSTPRPGRFTYGKENSNSLFVPLSGL
jgi:hypothetical protein